MRNAKRNHTTVCSRVTVAKAAPLKNKKNNSRARSGYKQATSLGFKTTT
jgi:hypothetical protein